MIPDVLGYPLEKGLSLLNAAGLSVLVERDSSKWRSVDGEERIARLIEVRNKKVVLLVVKVPISPIIDSKSKLCN